MMRSSESITDMTFNMSKHAAMIKKRRSGRKTLFALLVKFLLTSLEESGDGVLLQRARSVICTCTQRNRMGDLSFSPLEDVLEIALRQLVGELHWQRARNYRLAYLQQRHLKFRQRRQHAAASVNIDPTSCLSPSPSLPLNLVGL